MISALVLVLTLQSPEPTLDDRIAAFAKGDDSARAELVKLGVYAIRPLQKAREKAPEKVDALLFELKKAATVSTSESVMNSLEREFVFRVNGLPLSTVLLLFRDISDVDVSFLVEPANPLPGKISVEGPVQPFWKHLDVIGRASGLDWGLIFDTVVFSTPERLWPASLPPKPPDLSREDRARAEKLIERFADEAIGERENAQRELINLGPGAIHALEANLKRKEGEIAARCAAAMLILRPLSRPICRPPAAEGQELTPAATSTMAKLRKTRVDLHAPDKTLSELLALISVWCGTDLDVEDAPAGKLHVIHMQSRTAYEVLTLVTQASGLDFMVDGYRVWIDTPAKIREKLEPKR